MMIMISSFTNDNNDDCKKSTPGHIIVKGVASSENKAVSIRYPACTISRVCEIKGRFP